MLIENRLIELTWQAVEGNFDEIIQLADAAGFETLQNHGQLNIKGQVNTAIYKGLDPVTMFISLAFAFLGTHWPSVCPTAIDKINKEWRLRIKKRKKG